MGRKIIAALLIVGGILVLVHQYITKGVLIEVSDIDCHEFIAAILLSVGLGGLLFCRK
ncbi:hypothetical protein ES702_03985 [subsurface metagenome]